MDATQTKIGSSAVIQNQSAAPAAYDPYSDPECLLTTNEHAALRGCSASTIRRERNERRGVPFIAVNCNVVRYRRGDVLDFIAGLKRVETSKRRTLAKKRKGGNEPNNREAGAAA